jgi:hypothetical protein
VLVVAKLSFRNKQKSVRDAFFSFASNTTGVSELSELANVWQTLVEVNKIVRRRGRVETHSKQVIVRLLHNQGPGRGLRDFFIGNN